MYFNLRVVVNQVDFFLPLLQKSEKKIRFLESHFPRERDQARTQVDCFRPCKFFFFFEPKDGSDENSVISLLSNLETRTDTIMVILTGTLPHPGTRARPWRS